MFPEFTQLFPVPSKCFQCLLKCFWSPLNISGAQILFLEPTKYFWYPHKCFRCPQYWFKCPHKCYQSPYKHFWWPAYKCSLLKSTFRVVPDIRHDIRFHIHSTGYLDDWISGYAVEQMRQYYWSDIRRPDIRPNQIRYNPTYFRVEGSCSDDVVCVEGQDVDPVSVAL